MSFRGIRSQSPLPLVALLCLSLGIAACAHTGEPVPTSAEPDPDGEIARLRHDNAKLRKALKSAEERARLAERGVGDVEQALPSGRSLPVVKLKPKGGEAGVRHTDSVRLAPLPNSGGYDGGPDADKTWHAESYLAEEPDEQPQIAAYASATTPKSYRLVGSHLVAETRRKRAPRRSSGRSKGHTQGVIAEYDRAMKVYKAGRFPDAERAFGEIVRSHPKHEYADNALYWQGEAAYDQSHYSDALAAFTAVVERYGGGNKAPDALLKIGLCYGRLGDGANARDVLSQLIVAYPKARATGIARAKLDDFAEG